MPYLDFVDHKQRVDKWKITYQEDFLSHKSFQRRTKGEKEDRKKASIASVDLQDGPKNSKGAGIWCQDFPCEGQGKQQHWSSLQKEIKIIQEIE